MIVPVLGMGWQYAHLCVHAQRYDCDYFLHPYSLSGDAEHQCTIVTQAQQQPQVRTNLTVVIGYCFGAAAVLDLAASYPDPITDNVLGDFTSSRKATAILTMLRMVMC